MKPFTMQNQATSPQLVHERVSRCLGRNQRRKKQAKGTVKQCAAVGDSDLGI